MARDHLHVRTEALLDVIAWLEPRLGRAGAASLRVLDPDVGRGRYAGEPIEIDGTRYVHRPLRVWLDLAERLGARLCTPRAADPPWIELRFERLDPDARWAPPAGAPITERYGAESGFSRIAKAEDPGFVLDLREALGRVALAPGARVLDLGVNTGDEVALITALQPELDLRIVGVDHSASALAIARARLPAGVELVEADLAALPLAGLGRFDLIVSIGVLQSGALDDRELLRRMVQHHLAPRGAVVLGLPNCRYVDGEVEYGARMLNFRQPELGLLVKDVAFYRKYLQQHQRDVFVTGKHELFVTAVPRRSPP